MDGLHWRMKVFSECYLLHETIFSAGTKAVITHFIFY